MSDAQDKNGSNDHTIADAHSGSPSDTKPNLASFVPKQSLQPVIKAVDMDQDMQNKVIELATQSLEQFSLERDVAEFLKRQFDSLYGSTWHCVVGKNFGSFVTHETGRFIYLYIGPISLLLWKTS